MPSPCSSPSLSSLPLLFLFRTVGSPCPLKQMRMGAFLWMGTCCVSSVTPSVQKQRAEELGVGIPSRPRARYSSPPCHYFPHPSARQGRLLPMETTPAQFFTHVGFTAPRPHSAHPPRKELFCHRFLATVHSRLEAVSKVSAQLLFTRLWRRRIRPPPPPGGRSKKDLLAGAGKG